jgi:2-polyprenyl-6-methoxyphenol hydroxylase-like FAD-dependent oxidoreductase
MTAGLESAGANEASGIDTDIVVIGAGLSGTLAAIVLGRAGYRVALVDRNAVCPPEFRVEKIGDEQVAMMKRLGLFEALSADAAPFDEIVNARKGRILDKTKVPHFGFRYADIVAAMRRQLPGNVRFVVGRVDAITTSDDRQTVTIPEHGAITARLVVLATGMGDLLRRTLGIERHVIHQRQSLTFGFDIKPAAGDHFSQPALTYYGEQVADGIDYLSLFPVDGATRANLFTFREISDPWVKAFRQNPKETLATTLPGLSRVLGDFEIVTPVQNWLMDIAVAQNCRQAGVVLIGDAYQTSCPAAGTGVGRLLSDVERLCTVHVPTWLASPGMSAAKIGEFYDDPQKQAADAHALQMARYRRSLTVETDLRWRAHRLFLLLRRRLMSRIERFAPSVAMRMRLLRAHHA